MDTPAARSLGLLGLLHGGRPWQAADLTDRLGVSQRTLRRDVHRLRSLGYTIESSPGPGGAYRLQPSIKIPPLLLDADEVSSLITGLIVLESWAPQDPSASTIRVKLEQLLPPALRRRALATAVVTQVVSTDTDSVDWGLVGTFSDAIATGEHLRFTYTDRCGHISQRDVEPHRHILRGGHWYLVAYDHDRADWRLFRSDRITNPATAPGRSPAPDFPYDTIEEWLTADFGRTCSCPDAGEIIGPRVLEPSAAPEGRRASRRG